MTCGYKSQYGGKTFPECARIFIKAHTQQHLHTTRDTSWDESEAAI